jgi:transcriptional regulator with XRE-family HTH domain
MPHMFAIHEHKSSGKDRQNCNDRKNAMIYKGCMIGDHTTKLFLREWRQLKGLTQDQLAERLNTSKSVISELESGKKRWNQDHLGELAFALGCDPEDLLHPGPRPKDPNEPFIMIWNSIPDDLKPQALRVLQALKVA